MGVVEHTMVWVRYEFIVMALKTEVTSIRLYVFFVYTNVCYALEILSLL